MGCQNSTKALGTYTDNIFCVAVSTKAMSEIIDLSVEDVPTTPPLITIEEDETGKGTRLRRKKRRKMMHTLGRSTSNDEGSRYMPSPHGAVVDAQARVERLRAELCSAEEELEQVVGEKLKLPTSELGADGNASLQNGTILEQLRETLKCSICLDSYTAKNNIYATSCGHLYHKKCIERCYKAGHLKCPLCKQTLKMSQLHPIWI